jgi:hypothetical protein
MDYKSIKQIFHALSYLQYPLYILASVFAIKPYINGLDYAIEHLDLLISNLNYFFIFLGLGIGFAGLQDINKIHLKFEKKVLHDPIKIKIFLLITAISTALMLLFGVFGYFLIDNKHVHEISLGILILGIGFIGVLKLQLELVEMNSKIPIENKSDS